MHIGFLACIAALQDSTTIPAALTIMVLWSGYLLFGLDPTPDDEEHHH
jgi:hypothetical protein